MKTLMTATALALASQAPASTPEAELSISRAGTRGASVAPAQNFTGEVSVEMLHTPDGAERASAGVVSFTPGARTAWHSHPLGQTLIVTAGIGRIQRWGGLVQEIRVGDVIHIPPRVKHWHGAAPGTAMTHIAITEVFEGRAADWMEHVSQVQYEISPAPVSGTASGAAPAVISAGRP